MAKSKKEELEVVESTPVVKKPKKQIKKESTFYFFYSIGCAFCKQIEPIIEEINKEGKYEIIKLDMAEKDNQGFKNELQTKYNKQCGTPWFVDSETGNQACGFQSKDKLLEWLGGVDIPTPPRPKSPMPKPPYHGASKEEEKTWLKEYTKWKEENSHVPNLLDPKNILDRPRPKSDPPRFPPPTAKQDELDKWKPLYEKWKEENGHLPGLQPVETIMERFKQMQQNSVAAGSPPIGTAVAPQQGLNPDQNARITRLEQKLDKLISHLGVK